MPITFTSAVRAGGLGCEHFQFTFDIDGLPQTVTLNHDVDREDLDSLFSRAGFPVLLGLLWLRYRRRQGATVASLVGQTVVA